MSARFQVGDRVRVRDAHPPGHVRTPYYLRGKMGVVERIVAHLPNPEERAYGRDGLPELAVYWVAFRQQELWPDYGGAPGDTAWVDVYENWLESVEQTKE